MPYSDPQRHLAYLRERHKAKPELDRNKQRVRARANAILRERYRREYDSLVKEAEYEGVADCHARYRLALRTLKDRHPRAWKNATSRPGPQPKSRMRNGGAPSIARRNAA